VRREALPVELIDVSWRCQARMPVRDGNPGTPTQMSLGSEASGSSHSIPLSCDPTGDEYLESRGAVYSDDHDGARRRMRDASLRSVRVDRP
jgi:hypothetical protein